MSQNAESVRVTYCLANKACLLPDGHKGPHHVVRDSEVLAHIDGEVRS